MQQEEIEKIRGEIEKMVQEKPLSQVWRRVQEKTQENPNCEPLLLNAANILDAQRIMQQLPEEEDFDTYVFSLYARVLHSSDAALRRQAADGLIKICIREKQYQQAKKYLAYFSEKDRKRKQAQIDTASGEAEKAAEAYEQLLLCDYQEADEDLQGLYLLALHTRDFKRARMLAQKKGELARCFDMGRYREVSGNLEIALLEKDADLVIEVVKEMLRSVEQLIEFEKSPLYMHISFKKIEDPLFFQQMKKDLLESFQEGEEFEFLKDDIRWQMLLKEHISNG